MNAKHTLKRIAIFSPNSSPYYLSVLFGLRDAFKRRDIDVHIGFSYLDGLAMQRFCDLFRPDLIFEIDRSRNNADGMPRDVVSATWIQDWRSVTHTTAGLSGDNFGGSELCYFIVKPETLHVEPPANGHWDYLFIATDENQFHPVSVEKDLDACMVGYIPPLTDLSIGDYMILGNGRIVPPGEAAGGDAVMSIADLVERMAQEGLTWNRYDAREARILIDRIFEKDRRRSLTDMTAIFSFFGTLVLSRDLGDSCFIPEEQLYDIENRYMRALGRQKVIGDLLTATHSVELYGPSTWRTYPNFSGYYQGAIETDAKFRELFGRTRLNLHNAMSQMHPRVIDCMACAGVNLVNKIRVASPDDPGSLSRFFEPGEHFVEYSEDDLAEVVRDLLADDARRDRIGRAARDVVLADHTWLNRADKIIADYNRL